MTVDHVDHLVARERLAHPGVRSRARKHLFERFLRKIGNQNDRNVFLVRLRLEDFTKPVSLDTGKVDIEEDDVGGVASEYVVELDPTGRRQNGTTLALEQCST